MNQNQTDTQTGRDAFEKWCESIDLHQGDGTKAIAWLAWQAALSTQPQPVATDAPTVEELVKGWDSEPKIAWQMDEPFATYIRGMLLNWHTTKTRELEQRLAEAEKGLKQADKGFFAAFNRANKACEVAKELMDENNSLHSRLSQSPWIACKEQQEKLIQSCIDELQPLKSGVNLSILDRVLGRLEHMKYTFPSSPQPVTQATEEPDAEDGHDHEGFAGGCERAGHSPETCLEKVKAAFAAGKRVQYRLKTENHMIYVWKDLASPGWLPVCEYRIHPDDAAPKWEPKFRVGDRVTVKGKNQPEEVMHIPRDKVYQTKIGPATVTFRQEGELEPYIWSLPAPPEGQQWHRDDGWIEEMLPPVTDGGLPWRPMLRGELIVEDVDYVKCAKDEKFYVCVNACGQTADEADHGRAFCITRRPLPSPERVALGPSDIPPGSVIRHKNSQPYNWFAVNSVHLLNIKLGAYMGNLGTGTPTYEKLMDCLILRPGSTVWEPCSKEARP